MTFKNISSTNCPLPARYRVSCNLRSFSVMELEKEQEAVKIRRGSDWRMISEKRNLIIN